jgi:hypothetical protein
VTPFGPVSQPGQYPGFPAAHATGYKSIVDYRPEVREQLAIHGIRPGASTSPELIRDYLSHLYRYEIRQLRARLLRGDIPRADYVTHVIRLRLRYPLLSIPTRLWVL